MKSRRNFRKKTKSRKERKYTYAHKKKRLTRTRHKTKQSQARTYHRTKRSQAGVNDKDKVANNEDEMYNPCEENNASLDELIREKNCDNVEGHIEGQTIGKGKGYCSGKNCISEDSIETLRKGKIYQDPFTRKYLSLEKYDAERKKKASEKISRRLRPWLKTIKKKLKYNAERKKRAEKKLEKRKKRLEKRLIAIRESVKKKNLAVRKSFEEIKKKIQEPEWSHPIASFEGHISESLKEKNIAIRESFKNITVPAATWDGLLAAQKIAISVSYLLSQYARELSKYAQQRRDREKITNPSFKGLIASSLSASSFARLLNKYGMELIQYAQELDKSEQSIAISYDEFFSTSPLSSSDDSDSDSDDSDSDDSNSDEFNSDSEYDF